MNRLILIGNGYDRSCGLKSGYDDFIAFYIKDLIEYYINNNSKLNNVEIGLGLAEEYKIVEELSDIQKQRIKRGIKKLDSYQDLLRNEFIVLEPEPEGKKVDTNPHFLCIDFTQSILAKVLESDISNPFWVDFESAYYSSLKEIVNSTDQNEEKQERLLDLEDEIKSIKKSLNKYLRKQLEIRSENITYKDCNKETLLVNCLYGPLVGEGNYLYSRAPFEHKILVLNFNYTTLFEKHVNQFINDNERVYDEFENSTNKREFLNIHGVLHNPEDSNYPNNLLLGQNAIVFGYGDEENEDYQMIENSEIDEYFFNIKSFYYSLNNNYKKLLNFIGKGDFEIFSIGHSLGVSDRTMLREIFMNNNCKKIYLFHREFNEGSEEENLNKSMKSYFKNVIRLSRHFRQNHFMRSRLEPFAPEYKIPQFIEVEANFANEPK